MKITKNNYLAGFAVVVAVLALVRLVFPSVAEDRNVDGVVAQADSVAARVDSVAVAEKDSAERIVESRPVPVKPTKAAEGFPLASFFDGNGGVVKNRINSVPGFSRTFPDNK